MKSVEASYTHQWNNFLSDVLMDSFECCLRFDLSKKMISSNLQGFVKGTRIGIWRMLDVSGMKIINQVGSSLRALTNILC